MRRVMVMAGALALAGCQTAAAQTPDKAIIDKARAGIAAKLKDPPSARFTDLVRKTTPNARGEPTDVVCGAVNSKNSFGGYTGATPFVYLVQRGMGIIAEGDAVEVAAVRGLCTGKF